MYREVVIDIFIKESFAYQGYNAGIKGMYQIWYDTTSLTFRIKFI